MRTEPVMGTTVSFTVYDDAGDPAAGDRAMERAAKYPMEQTANYALEQAPDRAVDQAANYSVERAVERACEELHTADELFSTWKPWSPMSRLRRGAARLDMFPDDVASQLAAVLAVSWQLRRASDGWFDPWAIPGGVDPTGLVKGWALEQAAAVLRGAGLTAVVNGGGDIVTCGVPAEGSWRIGVRHPWRPESLACVLALRSPAQAVATSGSYERGAHFVDPHSGTRTPGAVASATVVGIDLAVADALATALVVGGVAALDGMCLVGYEAYLVGHDGAEHCTDGFPFS